MKFFETSKYHFFKKSTYISLRWIGIAGQLISVNFVYFFLDFKFDFLFSNFLILIEILSNLYLIFVYKKTQLSERSAFIFLLIDILILGALLYLTGGVANPFAIFLLVPSVFSSSNLSFKTNFLLVFITVLTILFLTFYSLALPSPISDHFHVSRYYYYSIPIALIIALIFLNYLAMTFGKQSRLRREALTKMEEVMAKEHELLSLGGQAAAAAHSLGTPLSTIKIITQDLSNQFNKHNIDRIYQLLIWGKLRPSSGKINTLITRSKKNRQLMEVGISKGKKAITNYKTLNIFENENVPTLSLVECKLETGRTHQIRVHMSHKGNNIVGDKKYKKKYKKLKNIDPKLEIMITNLNRQFLHAKTLGFMHPVKNKKMIFSCNLPIELESILKRLKNLSK